jgi:competence protein ComEC
MFSFVAIGYQLRKCQCLPYVISIYFSDFAFSTVLLFDVGFQLSYIALFFIICAALTSFFGPKKQALEIYLGILTVSFAAQIGTMPLSIYYFHQFPGLFSSRTSQSSRC